jgi:sterol desaturase/sphingolipid hydroxylase (fatty acid hydroxylase superfamily)
LKDEYLGTLASVLLLTVLFYVFERIRPAEQSQRILDRAANYLYLPFVLAWVLLLQCILAPWNQYLTGVARGGLLASILSRRGLWAEIVMGVTFAVLWDVWQYWIHRCQHAWPALWETHKFHHSEVALNTSSQARHHASSYVVYMIGYAPMMLLFGTLTPHFIVTVLMFRVWGFVNHANIRAGLGPFTLIIAGPQWHRIHHSVEREHLDKNFAAFFPFIDRIFGTYYKPARDEYPATGLVEAPADSQLAQATIAPLRGWYWNASR